MSESSSSSPLNLAPCTLEVAISVPLRRRFSYLSGDHPLPVPGSRLKVPFGSRQQMGVLLGQSHQAADASHFQVKPITAILDDTPVFAPPLLQLIEWASQYYHHPIGEVIASALPKLVRSAQTLNSPFSEERYRWASTSKEWSAQLKNAPAQTRLAKALVKHPQGLTPSELAEINPNWRASMKALMEKTLAERITNTQPPAIAPLPPSSVQLNTQQAAAVAAITPSLGQFDCHLLNGITGSGKTEVYFALIKHILAAGKQTLVLFPEIALTTQLVARFEARFGDLITALHSGLSDTARYRHWWRAKTGHARIVLGTRSAVFSCLPELGLVILDEEHDASFKQQEGFRYHARSVALKRAQLEEVPVVLGSATPSLETLHNVQQGRFQECRLTQRIGVAQLPDIHLIDTQQLPTEDGLSQPLLRAIQKRLKAGQQSLIFINRRGFAPVLYCTDCGWKADCSRCDAPMAVHQSHHALNCHHCGRRERLPTSCPHCNTDTLIALGEGTQRIEAALEMHFPDARIQRFDRDLLQSQPRLEAALTAVKNQEVDILVGTQLLTKGHDFPQVTLVGVVNADAGLHSTDFRATETLFQQLMQVAGRAGRGEQAGEVLIQTQLPQATFFMSLTTHDYQHFSEQAIEERQMLGYPPFGHLALFRANSLKPQQSLDFLREVAETGHQIHAQLGLGNRVWIFDAVDSPMPKRNGRYRAQLLLKADTRGALHQLLDIWINVIEERKSSRRLRWSIDVDPVDLF